MIRAPIVKIEDWAARQQMFRRLYAIGRQCIGDNVVYFIQTCSQSDIDNAIYVWLDPKLANAFWLCDRDDIDAYIESRNLTLVNSPAQFMAYGRRHGLLP